MDTQKPKSKRREILSWAITIAAAVVAALLIRAFVFEFVRVDGPSMQNTLFTDQEMLVTKVDYAFSSPQRGDIVICRFPEEEKLLVKRVIGLPGETIEAKGGKLYINGQESDNHYATAAPKDEWVDPSDPPQPNFDIVQIPDDCVFVLGDNRRDSRDSHVYGPLPLKGIYGVAHLVVYPFDQWKAIGK